MDDAEATAATVGGCAQCGGSGGLLEAVLIVLLIILIVFVSVPSLRPPALRRWLASLGRPLKGPAAQGAARGARGARDGMEAHPDHVAAGDQRRSVFQELSRLYSTADVDPAVTGQLYAWRDDTRNTYGMRTSHGGKHGLHEFSTGVPGDVGVDQGPWGMDEYGGRIVGYDDGIPEAWNLPSTPQRWYRPRQRDYWGEEGATPYTVGLYALTEPDHEPNEN